MFQKCISQFFTEKFLGTRTLEYIEYKKYIYL